MAGLIDSLYAPGKISPACKLDAVVLVEAENLNRDAFASLRHSSSNSLRARSLNAPSQVTFNAAPAADVFDLLVERASKACGYGDLDITTLGAFESLNPTKNPRFVDIKAGDLRKDESSLLQTLESLDESSPRNLVIVAPQIRLRQHPKRQYIDETSSSNGNWTQPEGGIFARYQLFSTPLILTLILVGGLLLPIVYFAVSQLAQIQTPDQMGVRKDTISGDKKTQ